MFKPALPPTARALLDLARADRAAAAKQLAALDPDALLALVCETPAARRAELIALAPLPEALIPRLPPAELVFTAKAVGLHDAGWLLEHASEEQLVACLDLDGWALEAPDREKLHGWLAALADAGEETLLRAAHALDAELFVLELRDRARVTLKPDGDDSWEPPVGAHTLDGQFYLEPLRDDDDFADLTTFLRVLFQNDYWTYYRLLQGAQHELESDAEEWALRWRDGRLQDLGFPPFEDAKRIYAFIRPDQLGALPKPEDYQAVGEWALPCGCRICPSRAIRSSRCSAHSPRFRKTSAAHTRSRSWRSRTASRWPTSCRWATPRRCRSRSRRPRASPVAASSTSP